MTQETHWNEKNVNSVCVCGWFVGCGQILFSKIVKRMQAKFIENFY